MLPCYPSTLKNERDPASVKIKPFRYHSFLLRIFLVTFTKEILHGKIHFLCKFCTLFYKKNALNGRSRSFIFYLCKKPTFSIFEKLILRLAFIVIQSDKNMKCDVKFGFNMSFQRS